MLVVAERGHVIRGLAEACQEGGGPLSVTVVCPEDEDIRAVGTLGAAVTRGADIASLPAESFDDVIYFGAKREIIEALNDKLVHGGIVNIVTGDERVGQAVSVGIGRIHYGLTRWVGTRGGDAQESYKSIPATGEIRRGEKILVIGAAGPMGQMHVIRCIASGVPAIEITGSDVDDGRLAALEKKAGPLARAMGIGLRLVNSRKGDAGKGATYVALMAPAAALVADAVKNCGEKCLINVFAGIPAATREPVDMDAYIAKRCFMFGTSGSAVRDMKIVLAKMETGQLDTNASVDAISGMAGAIEGLAAVENRTLSGKIVVYPEFRELGLVPLADLARSFPSVAAKLEHGMWSKAAEEELHRALVG